MNTDKILKVQSRKAEVIGVIIGISIAIAFGSWVLSWAIPLNDGMMHHGCSQGEIGITCVGASQEEQKQACENMMLGNGVTNSTKVASELCDFSRSSK